MEAQEEVKERKGRRDGVYKEIGEQSCERWEGEGSKKEAPERCKWMKKKNSWAFVSSPEGYASAAWIGL